ncbi:MAG TPA: hypothetical protein VFT74_07750, partial [Isosphaeraceae bacterium]|nr:hypothetical protein [Isosphaeraceae bacterium]
MIYTIEVDLPSTWTGLTDVKYNFSTPNLDQTGTSYSNTVGTYRLTGPQVDHPITGSYVVMDRGAFAAPKDAGPVTINIEAVAHPYGQTQTTDTIKDSLTIEVEAPTVNWFKVADN